jgi:hypothetical protein
MPRHISHRNSRSKSLLALSNIQPLFLKAIVAAISILAIFPLETKPATAASVAGTVFYDTNGNKTQDTDEYGTNAGSSSLKVLLINNTTNLVTAIGTISTAADTTKGTYTFATVATGTYTVQITTAAATVGFAPPATTLPTYWQNTGENLNGTIDGTVDGKQTITVGAANITNVKFGINQQIIPNPNLNVSGTCAPTMKIALILDASLSIDATELGQMRTGVKTLLKTLADKAPNRFQVGIVEFGLLADRLRDFTPVNATTALAVNAPNTTTNYATSFNNDMDTKFPDRNNSWSPVTIGGSTNWEAGFQKGYDTLNSADLVLFITDGNPNAYLDSLGASVDLGGGGNPSADDIMTAISETVPVANLWKSQGKKIIAVGVAEVTPSVPTNFKLITDGSNIDLLGTSNVNTADYMSISTFADFGAGMTDLVNKLCASAPVNVNISGKVFRDTNGDRLLGTGEAGTNFTGLNAVLYNNGTNKVVATTAVSSTDGTYAFSNITSSDNYTIEITTATATLGVAPPAITLPSNWVTTGENLNSTLDATIDGKLSISVGATDVANANFGIEQLPTAVGTNPASQTNPGGTIKVAVPNTLFTSSTDLDGTVAAYKITSFPTNATSITIDSTNYTSATFPVAGVTATLAQLNTVQVDPVDGAVDVSISFKAIDNASQESSNTATPKLSFTVATAAPFTCDATLYQVRANGSDSILNTIDRTTYPWNINTFKTFAGESIRALAFNSQDKLLYAFPGSSSQLIQIDATGATQTFSITGFAANTNISAFTINTTGTGYAWDTQNAQLYSINLSTKAATTVGSASTYANHDFGDIAFSPQDSKIYGVNNQGPNPPSLATINPSTGSIATVGSSLGVSGGAFGSVFFDGNGTMYGYNNPGNFYQINTTAGTATQSSTSPAVSGSDGASCVSPYASPLNVTVSGTVFNDSDSSKVKNGTEAGTNAGSLNAVLVDSGNKVIATAAVAALDGSYSFPTVPVNGSYTVQITTATAALNQAPPLITLPSNWVSTGENFNGTVDTTVDSKTSFGVGIANISGVNFGIKLTNAKVLLVKRITAINGTSIDKFNDNTNILDLQAANDNNSFWPSPLNTDVSKGSTNISSFLRGAIDGIVVKPGDEIEYTIYFVNAGGNDAKNVKICDRIIGSQTFVDHAYGTSQDIEYRLGTHTVRYLTKGVNLSFDRAELDTTTATVSGCNSPSITGTNNGTVAIYITGTSTTVSNGQDNITTIPGSAVPVNTDSYGYFRFKTRVMP